MAPLYALPPHRFWDETVRVPGLFDRFRVAENYTNAIPCFDRMARHRYWELTKRPDFDPSKPSVVSVFQPKAGGTFLHNRMLELGYQEFWWCFPSQQCYSYCIAGIDALELFMSGGCTCHTHARPEANILAAFDRAGVDKVWVHLRNPAESVISSYYHYRGEGHGDGPAGDERRREALSLAARNGLTPGMDLSTFVVDHIAWYVDWVTEWLRFADRHPGLVVFSYYSELANPHELFTRVFGELGIELNGSVTTRRLPADRYRSKSTASWQSQLERFARCYVERRVRADLERFPQFERLWS